MNESDFNEHKTPNGGWQFRQPEINWSAPTPIANTLNQTVNYVVAMRKKNPVQTAKFKWATNPEAVKTEVLRFNRKRLGLNPDGAPLPFPVPPSNQNGSQAVVAGAHDPISGLKRAAKGTALGLDWLGKGTQTVAQELADKRAATCVVCPRHTEGEWYVTAPAELIKKSIEAWKSLTGKTDFKFETAQGDKLKSCGVCHCLMTLKCFVPLDHILSKTPSDVMEEFPSTCWIKNKDA